MSFKNRRVENEFKNFNAWKSLIGLVATIAVTILIKQLFLPDNVEDFGAWSTLPALFLVVYIFITKRIIEALVLATFVGWIMCAQPGGNVLTTFNETFLATMQTGSDACWLIIVCGTMGGIIALIERSGGAFAFGEWAAKRAKSEKAALMWTWILGVIIFIDDYLNSCTVGSCMANITDKYKTPREMLAYVADSTAAPLCVIIPFTTWGVFAGRIMIDSGWAEGQTTPVSAFITTIPFNFYGWIAALLVPCVIFGIVPKFGAMKKAYERTANGGPLAPEGSDKISILSSDKETLERPENPRVLNFLLPIVVLVGSTIIAGTEMQVGVVCTVVFMLVIYTAQGIMTANEFWDVFIKGLQNMTLPLLLMVTAFEFGTMNETIGFTRWCIETGSEHMTAATAPLCIFIILAFTEFITGTNWGMYIIALPIVIPLAYQLDCSAPLLTAACLSAGVFGSHICFYSDATVITSAACGCDNFRHAITQMPFGLLAAGISAVLFTITGFVMA